MDTPHPMTLIAWLLCLTFAGAILYVGISACHALGPCADPTPEELPPPTDPPAPTCARCGGPLDDEGFCYCAMDPPQLPPPIVIPLPPPAGQTTDPVYRAPKVRTADRQSVRATRKTG